MAAVRSYNYVTGHYSDVITTIRQKISAYRFSSDGFKIGMTGNLEARAAQYSLPYLELIAIYKTTSEPYIRTMETAMIEEYWLDCDNTIGGGGGPVSGPPYYLYVARY